MVLQKRVRESTLINTAQIYTILWSKIRIFNKTTLKTQYAAISTTSRVQFYGTPTTIQNKIKKQNPILKTHYSTV